MSDQARNAAVEAIAKALVPLVRVMLDVGIGSKEAEDLLRTVYVNTAARMLEELGGREPPVGLVALRCGLPRKDVGKRLQRQSLRDERYANKLLFNRILDGWREDFTFRDRNGAPLELKVTGPKSFETLCQRYGRDFPPSRILEELKRDGAIVEAKSGRWRLVAKAYRGTDVKIDALSELGTHAQLVLDSMRADLKGSEKPANVHARLAIDVDPRHLPRIRRELRTNIDGLMTIAQRLLDSPTARANPQLGAGAPLGLVVSLVGSTENNELAKSPWSGGLPPANAPADVRPEPAAVTPRARASTRPPTVPPKGPRRRR
jgi:hypothetical protein